MTSVGLSAERRACLWANDATAKDAFCEPAKAKRKMVVMCFSTQISAARDAAFTVAVWRKLTDTRKEP